MGRWVNGEMEREREIWRDAYGEGWCEGVQLLPTTENDYDLLTDVEGQICCEVEEGKWTPCVQ